MGTPTPNDWDQLREAPAQAPQAPQVQPPAPMGP